MSHLVTIDCTQHRKQPVFSIVFTYERKLIELLRDIRGCRYSSSKQYWYIYRNKNKLQELLNYIPTYYKVKLMPQAQLYLYEYHRDHRATLASFKAYLQSKRYQESTVKTY